MLDTIGGALVLRALVVVALVALFHVAHRWREQNKP